MYQVRKFTFDIADHFSIAMPQRARLLAVALQNGQPCIWALVNPESPQRMRQFRLVGSGIPIPYEECERHVGTIQTTGGALVFHLFDLGEEP